MIQYLKRSNGKTVKSLLFTTNAKQTVEIQIFLFAVHINLHIKHIWRYLKSGVMVEPRFRANDDGLAIYVQRPPTFVDDTVLTIATKLDYRLWIKTTTYSSIGLSEGLNFLGSTWFLHLFRVTWNSGDLVKLRVLDQFYIEGQKESKNASIFLFYTSWFVEKTCVTFSANPVQNFNRNWLGDPRRSFPRLKEVI